MSQATIEPVEINLFLRHTSVTEYPQAGKQFEQGFEKACYFSYYESAISLTIWKQRVPNSL